MKEKSIRLNAVLNIILTLSNILFPLITFPYVSRILNPEGMGLTSFFASISSYGTLIASLGISTYGIREVAKVRGNKKSVTKIFQELLILNFIMSIIVSILLLLGALGISQFKSNIGLLSISCLTVLSSPFGLSWFYSGIEEYSYITRRSIVFKLLSLMLIFLLVKSSNDYITYAGITLFSTLGANVLNIIHSRKYVSFKLLDDLEFRKHFKPMWYLFASLLAVNIYTNLDTVMLGFINGNEAVGLYSVASKIKWLLLSVVTSISAVLLPRLSFYISSNDKSQFNKILRESMAIIFLISIPLTMFFILVARDSILLLGGEDYLGATTTMQMLMPILLISGFSNITGNQILLPSGKEKYFMRAVSTGAVVNLILNFILMPSFGIVGASVATLMAELTQMTIQFKYSTKELIGNVPFKSIRNYIIASLFSSFILVLFFYIMKISNTFFRLSLSGVIFGGVYFIILILLKDKLMFKLLGMSINGDNK